MLLSGAKCRLFEYGPAAAAVVPKPCNLLPHLKPDLPVVYLSGTGLPRLPWKGARVRVIMGVVIVVVHYFTLPPIQQMGPGDVCFRVIRASVRACV